MNLVQQIGDFKDWNILNSNNPKISSSNLRCKEPPPSPRGGESKISIHYNTFCVFVDNCSINWFLGMSSKTNPVVRCVTKGIIFRFNKNS